MRGDLGLAPNTELGDDRAVALNVVVSNVIEQTTTLTNDLHQATASVVVVLVGTEVLSQPGDPIRQQRDLHFGRARVGLVLLVLRKWQT